MKPKNLILPALFVLLTLNGLAQDTGSRFSFELGLGPSFPTQNLGGADLNTGVGFEGIFHYRFMPHMGTYAGWGWNKFSADNSFAGNNMDFEETGYVFGLEFKHPIGTSNYAYYLRAGGLYNHIEAEDDDGNITDDTGHGLGWQLAGGIDVPLGGKWSLTPGVKFNALNREFDDGEITRDLDLRYLTARVGILWQF